MSRNYYRNRAKQGAVGLPVGDVGAYWGILNKEGNHEYAK
jgi:hypothetical protein